MRGSGTQRTKGGKRQTNCGSSVQGPRYCFLWSPIETGNGQAANTGGLTTTGTGRLVGSKQAGASMTGWVVPLKGPATASARGTGAGNGRIIFAY